VRAVSRITGSAKNAITSADHRDCAVLCTSKRL